ncbi:enhancer of mRNA decapping [Saguinus oedipus]|uniref:Enhancer of mRNA decapping n=1 Tax=Saguinus oedipus TaxID=9490 RepID=A0ABQ9V207_SAGOE|nr:enhancer of mRNA decapping [Saguinus oedipus]
MDPATPKKSGVKNGQMKNKDDECFGDDIEEIPDTDFDFEGNVALFDKAAMFEEIDTYERRSGTRSRGIPNERPTRYRHDENILESEPIVYRRITVPHNVSKEFCTANYPPLTASFFTAPIVKETAPAASTLSVVQVLLLRLLDYAVCDFPGTI